MALDTAVSPRYLLSQNRPNPFVAEHGATAIGFDLGQRGPAKLQIFNATERLVRVLVDRPLDAGSHAMWWDGRNDGGAEAASWMGSSGAGSGDFQPLGFKLARSMAEAAYTSTSAMGFARHSFVIRFASSSSSSNRSAISNA